MAKPEKPAPAATEGAAAAGAAKPTNKKKLLLIAVGVLVLCVAAGAGWYFTKAGHHAEEAKAPPPATPKFMALEPFTVNLQNDGGEQFLQVGITLKFFDPELEEKIKLHMPEIRSRLLLLLSSKHAAALTPVEGKKQLAQEIIAETKTALGMRTPPAPKIVVHENHTAPEAGAASAAAASTSAEAASAPEAAAPAPAPAPVPAPVAAHGDTNSATTIDVLFTSFIIQ